MNRHASDTRTVLVERAQRAVKDIADLGLTGLDDGDLVDLVYDLRRLERRIAGTRRDFETELPDQAEGRQARTWMASNGYQYSFNHERIVADTIDATASAFEAFRLLVDTGVMKFSDRITSVEALYLQLDLPLVVVRHEIEDGDPEAHVGKYPKPATRKYAPKGDQT